MARFTTTDSKVSNKIAGSNRYFTENERCFHRGCWNTKVIHLIVKTNTIFLVYFERNLVMETGAKEIYHKKVIGRMEK